jgi:hypothetical protein
VSAAEFCANAWRTTAATGRPLGFERSISSVFTQMATPALLTPVRTNQPSRAQRIMRGPSGGESRKTICEPSIKEGRSMFCASTVDPLSC